MKKLIYHKPWNNLSMAEKAEMIGVAVRNGITSLPEIKAKYNEFAEGGYLDWKEKANKYKHLDIDNDNTYDYEGWYNENPQRAWDFLNGSPDAHFDDAYKTVYHPTFSTQSKYSGVVHPKFNPHGYAGGKWNEQGTQFTMSSDGYRGPVSMDERKWYLENAEDNGVQLKEVDGSLPVYDGIPWGGVLPAVTVTNQFAGGGYMEKAKAMIRANEGWRSKPYKDAPKGKNWRSVGYGFNDSGFWERYPEGISKHYENGITKAQAEKELDYFLGKAEKQLKGIYGKRWNNFNDDQKAAILDTYYQRPASVGSKSGFYGAVMSGKDGAPYLGVQGFGDRNQSRRDLYRGRGVTAPVSFESIAEPVVSGTDEVLHFEPLNPQVFGMQLPTYQAPVIDTIDTIDRIDTIDKTYDPAAIEKQERQDNLRRFGMFMSMLDGTSGQDSGMPDFIDMLADKPITYGNGGHLYDGTTENSQQMRNGKYFATNSKGDSYYVSPSALTSDEVNVIIPETFITANPDDVARGNAQRWWREHSNVYGEKGLEQVSPEFDLIGLAPLVKPIVNRGLRSAGRIIGKTNRLTNSPLTGNWTKIGNREYRLSPNSLGANGAPIESRAVTPQITAENAVSITPEQWTAAQDAAIARGDMAEAQRLRDLHSASVPSATPEKYYRGTQTKRTSYPDRHIDEEVGEMNGIYMTKNPKYAKTYGDVEKFYLHSNNPLNTEGSWTGVIDDATRTKIENSGYDAIVNNRFDTGFLNKLLRNSRDETITFNGKNIKLANAVTYDDKGVRIPLGERDNFNVNDIRYGLLPLGIGLAGYGLSQKK